MQELNSQLHASIQQRSLKLINRIPKMMEEFIQYFELLHEKSQVKIQKLLQASLI